MEMFPAQRYMARPRGAGTFDLALMAPEEKPAMLGYF